MIFVDLKKAEIQKLKYYNYKKDRPLDLQLDGCDLAEWNQLYGKALYAKHPKGFKIFLSPDRIVACDEYADFDPYTMEQNIGSNFHKRRIEITIALVREAVYSISDKSRILDLGCGQGHITQEMHRILTTSEFSGLDRSISAIEYANEHYPSIDFAVGDVYNTIYSRGYFDIVVCNNLWEHVPDPLCLLSKIKEYLKPGGYLIVSTPSRYRVANLIRILKGKPIILISKHHVTEYTVGQVLEQLSYGGFRVERILSKPISIGSLKIKLIQWLLAMFISTVGSHHKLESTVFYLAKLPFSSSEK